MNVCLCLGSLLAAFLSASDPSQGPDTAAASAADVLRSEPIQAGYVIAHARYVPHPYLLEVQGQDVLLNGYHIKQLPPQPRFGGRSGRFGRGRSRSADATAAEKLERIERWLNHGWALIIAEDGTMSLINSDESVWLLQVLNSDESVETKTGYVEEPRNGTAVAVDLNVWRDLVSRYKPSEDLRQRLEEEYGVYGTYEAYMATTGRDGGPLLTGLFLYGLNVGGMVLVVLAFGSLLSRQPPRDCACHTCAHCGDGASFLVRNIALIVVLSTFDLACTLFAGTTGEMLEMNPLADPLMKSPAALAAFKLSATLTGATILVGLRRNRRAQVASWWLCLVCSLLTFRWVAFHSLFVT
jgi:Domain of unknown function (DUF5658)